MLDELNALIEKYTTQPQMLIQDDSDAYASRKLMRMAMAIQSTEADLARAASQMRDVAEKIQANLLAGPGSMVYGLNQMGEIHGTAIARIDALIAVRAVQIETLREYVAYLVG